MENLYWTICVWILAIGGPLVLILSLYEWFRWRRFAYDLEVDGVLYEKVRYEVDRKHKEIRIYDDRKLVTVLPYSSYIEIERYVVTKVKEKDHG